MLTKVASPHISLSHPSYIEREPWNILPQLSQPNTCWKLTFLGHSEQAHRVCGGGSNGRWQLWMPSFLTNETILYAQSFSATIIYQIWTRHFDSSKALVLKDQAVTRINRSLTESTGAVSEATVASVLCLAYSTHMEVSYYTCFVNFPLLHPHNRRAGIHRFARFSWKCWCSASFTTLDSILSYPYFTNIWLKYTYFKHETANLASIIQDLGRANYLTHMNGLKRMIELNGGWSAVSSNELLGDMLAM